MFNQTLRRDGKKHTNCYSCYSKTRDADPSSYAHPTPAQVQDAQASIKNAQAVLLAANIDYNSYNTTLPVLPNLPKYDTDHLNKYMMSENYSLAATTSSVPASPFVAATPTIKPWRPDSASTFSITDNIKDLHRPQKLPAPIPITGANDANIYATHVGSARFDHRLQVYFVPLSAVKLLSLGALSNLGYSYASESDRCLTITTPFGRSTKQH
jgi:hypothetical protein